MKGVTVQFVDSLPEGLDDSEWMIVATWPGDILSKLTAVSRQGGLTIDLTIRRDHKMALLRVVPDIKQGVIPDTHKSDVYHLHGATAFFLDMDGRVTDNFVSINATIHTSDVPVGLPAGYVRIWRRRHLLRSAAS